MVTVFDAALKVIARHRVHAVYVSAEEGYYACHGCAWTGLNCGEADIHVATMIDEEVE